MSRFHDFGEEPSSFLVENIDLLPRGRALDLAMGRGRNAVYLAEAGWETEGIDISEEAVELALELAQRAGVHLNVRVQDLEGQVDFDPESFDLIVCFNYLHRPLIPKIKIALRTGGMVVYETFIVDQAAFGRPRNPDYLLERNELLRLFQDFRCLRYREGIVGSTKSVAGIVAEKI